MRTVPIIQIIKRYGLTSKRLSPKNRIKYEDAISTLKGMNGTDFEIESVIDNDWEPNKSISHHCQIPGCGQCIRYEYVLKDKRDEKKKLVVGSTCVWPTLGLGELGKKEFQTLDKAVREHGLMVSWRAENQDVVEKLNRLKSENLTYFRAFWEEIEYSRLMDEDTEFIRNVDVDKEIQKRDEAVRRRKERQERRRNMYRSYSSASASCMSGNVSNTGTKSFSAPSTAPISDAEYEKVLKCLEVLASENPKNRFYANLLSTSKKFHLTANQIFCIKKDANYRWYVKNIKGTDRDCYDTCQDVIDPIITGWGIGFNPREKDKVDEANTRFSNESEDIKMAWKLYKIKNVIVG